MISSSTSASNPARCPLCAAQGKPFYEAIWLICPECGGLFRPREYFPSPEEERLRYEEHLNDVHDPRFQAFVAPIADRVLADFSPEDLGLDFGSGVAPIVWHVLNEAGYTISTYDPFFAPYPERLEKEYAYITCCEVIEHFHRPAEEFERMKSLLRPGGRLYCMTMLYHEGIDFLNWHYRRDDTHVFIYQRKTIEWIAERFEFSDFEIAGRLIVFTK